MGMVGMTPNVMFGVFPREGCYIHMNRETIAEEALEAAATHLLFIDADMQFEPTALMDLLNADVDIIGADYHFKKFPLTSVTILSDTLVDGNIQLSVWKELKNLPKREVISFHPTYSGDKDWYIDPDFDPKAYNIIVKMPREKMLCRALGTGFMLIKMDVFKHLPRPLFFFRPKVLNNEEVGVIGEDIWFCDLARAYGYNIWSDPTIPIRHVGIQYY